VVDHGVGQADALAVPLGQRADEAAAHLADATAVQAGVDTALALLALDALEGGAVGEVLLDAHFGIQRHALRQVTDVLAHLHRLVQDVVSGDDGAAGGRREVGGEDAHDRRLAGAVVAEQPDNFVAPDLETDVGNGQHGAEVLGKVVNFNHEVRPVGQRWGTGRGGQRDRATGNRYSGTPPSCYYDRQKRQVRHNPFGVQGFMFANAACPFK